MRVLCMNIQLIVSCVCLQAISLPEDLVEGAIQGVHGAAANLLEHLYEVFTGKK